MKRLKIWFCLAGFVSFSTPVLAQFSISKVTPQDATTQFKADTVKAISSVTNPFFSEARFLAEKRRLRKERNTVSCTLGLNMSQTKFDNWAAGGTNTFAGFVSLTLSHVYNKGKLSMSSSLDSKYGMSVISGDVTKNLDYFVLDERVGWSISKNWSYSASVNLRSQWTKGFRSSNDKTMVSNIMSPGTLSLGVGLTYQALKKVPLKITINPLSGSMMFVLSDTLSRQGAFGIEPGKHQKSALGSNLQIDLNQQIAKGKLNYITYIYATTNYKQNNYVEWKNTFRFVVTRIISADIFWRMIYNEIQITPRHKPLQWNYTFGLGVSYTFKNK